MRASWQIRERQDFLRPLFPQSRAVLRSHGDSIRRRRLLARHASTTQLEEAGVKLVRDEVGVSPRYRPFLDEWDKGFVDAEEEEVGYWLELVQGALPKELEGTLFRNGPGKFSISGRAIDHPYDGDGFVTSTTFKGGRAYFRACFVHTAE